MANNSVPVLVVRVGEEPGSEDKTGAVHINQGVARNSREYKGVAGNSPLGADYEGQRRNILLRHPPLLSLLRQGYEGQRATEDRRLRKAERLRKDRGEWRGEGR